MNTRNRNQKSRLIDMTATDVLIGGLVKRLYAQRIDDVDQHRRGIARQTDEQAVRRLFGVALDEAQT